MGRGRAKAKQTKVARELKYSSGPTTDLQRLQAELQGIPDSDPVEEEVVEEEPDPYEDLYAKYADDDGDDQR